MKKPAVRGGAKAGLRNAAVAACAETYALEPAPLQVFHVQNRFGLTAATARAVAELAFPVIETWRARA